jgi:hypothetical protein
VARSGKEWQGVARSGNVEKPLFYPRKNLYNQNFCRIIFLEEVNHTKALRWFGSI